MKITGWTSFEDEQYQDIDKMTHDEFIEATDLVVNEIRSHGYKFHGGRHQEGYCPIIDDKWLYGVSMRSWGAIMQRAYDLPNEDGLGYVIWAWTTPENEKEVLPERN